MQDDENGSCDGEESYILQEREQRKSAEKSKD